MTTEARIRKAAERSMECSVKKTREQLKRGLSGLATIGSTAPFVGLFGTVIGIMNSFKGSTGTRATMISAVSGGISEALVTTSLGLLVAVPAVWAYNYFTTRLELFEIEMNNSVDDVSAYLYRIPGRISGNATQSQVLRSGSSHQSVKRIMERRTSQLIYLDATLNPRPSHTEGRDNRNFQFKGWAPDLASHIPVSPFIRTWQFWMVVISAVGSYYSLAM